MRRVIRDDRIDKHFHFLRTLRAILAKLGTDYWDDMVNDLPCVGKPSNTSQQVLDLLGLHPSSVEFHLNVVDSAEQIWNSHKFFTTTNREDLRASMIAEMAAGIQLLEGFGYNSKAPMPEIIEKFFSYVHGPMDRPTIDVPPLSETAELSSAQTTTGTTSGGVCAKAATAFDDLRLQRGFSAGKTPNALLYHLLRHALQLGYHQSAVHLHETNGLLSPADRLQAYQEPAFVHVAAPQVGRTSESRYRLLYPREQTITGAQSRTVAEFIPRWVTAGGLEMTLADQLAALSVLEHAGHRVARAGVRRAHRSLQLSLGCVDAQPGERAPPIMRRPKGPDAARELGLHLGAFGWIENLKPDSTALPAPSV